MAKKIVVAVVLVLGLGIAVLFPRRQDEQGRLPPDVVDILETGDSFVLLSLDPLAGAETSHDMFHEHAVLGRVDIRDAVQRRELLRSLNDGIANAESKLAKCWSPRHGIRAAIGKEAVDLVICFECLHLYWYMTDRSGMVLTNGSPKKEFSRALESAGVPRPDAPK